MWGWEIAIKDKPHHRGSILLTFNVKYCVRKRLWLQALSPVSNVSGHQQEHFENGSQKNITGPATYGVLKTREKQPWLILLVFSLLLPLYDWRCHYVEISLQWKKLTFLLLYKNNLVSPLLQNCFVCWDRWNGTWCLQLMRPCYVALGRVLILVVCGMGWGAIYPQAGIDPPFAQSAKIYWMRKLTL